MDRAPFYLRTIAVACLAIALLGIGVVFVIGYRPPTFGRVATIVLMAVCALGLFLLAKHLESRPKE